MSLKAVVIEDEELPRIHLVRMLRDCGVDVLAEGESGVDAISLCETFTPDLLFLDIQMPDMTGMQAAAALRNFEPLPKIVFVTGYSEFAVDAFEKQAFDYLLKPVSQDRLILTIKRAMKPKFEVQTAVESLSDVQTRSRLTPLQRLPVRTGYSVKLLRIGEIEFAISKEKRVIVRANGTEHRTYYTLTQLEELLPDADFVRIHASAIVRANLIDSVNYLGNHSYSVSLSNGQVLPVGRTYYEELQSRLGI